MTNRRTELVYLQFCLNETNIYTLIIITSYFSFTDGPMTNYNISCLAFVFVNIIEIYFNSTIFRFVLPNVVSGALKVR